MPQPAPTETDFIEQHWALAHWVANRRVLTAGDRGDRADIESDAAFGLFKAARTWRPDGGSSPATWVRRTVEHAITDGLRARHHERRAAGRERRTVVAFDDVDAELLVHTDDLERLVDRVDLAKAIASLPARERKAVVGYYWGDLTYAAVGALVGLSEAGACLMVQRAATALAASLRGVPVVPKQTRRVLWAVDEPPAQVTQCAHCSSAFFAHRPDERYCSNAHRQAAYRARRKNSHGPHPCPGWGPVLRSTVASWTTSTGSSCSAHQGRSSRRRSTSRRWMTSTRS